MPLIACNRFYNFNFTIFIIMIQFPNAKINLGLHIVAKRADGFHDIETVMYPVPQLLDALEITESSDLQLHVSGTSFVGDMYENIVVKAHQLLQAKYNIPNVTIYLHKGIPHGAGLGGGSADAAFMLQMLNTLFDLKLNTLQLQTYASELGSDCAFFVNNKPALATGRGEVLTPFALDLNKYKIALIKPSISINTALAYSKCKPAKPCVSIIDILQMPIETWHGKLSNDFEALSGEHVPLITQLKETLYQAGSLYAALSGSGSTVFGIFEQRTTIKVNANATLYWSDL